MAAKGFRLISLLSVLLLLVAVPTSIYALDGGDLGGTSAGFMDTQSTLLSYHSMAMAGDVNGDGYDDFLIGAPYNNEVASEAGMIYLILGGPGGWGNAQGLGWGQAFDLSNSPAVIKYSGEASLNHVGETIAGAGDVNGDGYDDFLVGCENQGAGGTAYLVLGSATPSSASLSTAIQYTGEATGDNAGDSVAGAGDVNGDGYDDFLVGARDNSDNGSSAGAAYLVLGSATPSSANLSTAIQYTGASNFDYVGSEVAGAGDVDGDGHTDMLIGGPPGSNNAGAVYLVLGSDSPFGINLSSAISYTGQTGDYAASSVAGAGDVNGDGYGDFLVNAPMNDGIGTDSGLAYLVLGSAAPASAPLSTTIQYQGEAAQDYAAESVAGVGDVNGDGYDDVLIGARGNDGGAPGSGAAYLVLGRVNPQTESLSQALQYTGVYAEGAGTSVGGGGDVNGDGYTDLLIGSYDGSAYLELSDYATPGAPPIRHRRLLLDDAGDALPVHFEQAGVTVDIEANALEDGDISVARHVYHPCNTHRRLQMPIWTLHTSKQNPQDLTNIALRFRYTPAQIAGMTEANLVVWTRPAGQPCSEWTQLDGDVDADHNIVTYSGLNRLGQQYTLSDTQPSATDVAIASADAPFNLQTIWPAMSLLALLALSSAIVHWYRRAQQSSPSNI